ncbi:cytochrome P450 [Mycena capillaripes]|nr:cytochrome P450 [Mycena capillaripes]
MVQILPQTISASPWAFAILLVILAYALRWGHNRSKLPLPPGPKQLPFVGNLFDVPRDLQWETYHEWSKQLNSDIIHLNVAGTSIIVLSSMEAVKELFERRSSLYSNRPRLPMLTELMGWDFGIGLMNYGDRWRSHRKILHDAFHIGAAKQFHTQELAAAHTLLRRILQDPRDVMEHFRHMMGALMMDVTYGIDVRSSDDPYITLAKDAMHGFSVATIPGAFLVDTIPALKYVPEWAPGAEFKRKARQWKKITRDLLEVPFSAAKQNIAIGTTKTSFTSLNLRILDDATGSEKEDQEAVVKAAAANMYAAGADTTVSALGTFILGMLVNPEAQKKAQAEIDSVVGAGQLPDFADKEALPYVSAIVKEVLRWRNVTPIAIPHHVGVEDEYRGYRIPAGSIVIGNAWAILHDENMYPDPQSFNPERFLLDGKLNPAIRDPETVAFFWTEVGALDAILKSCLHKCRICPGMHMATATLWIKIASILSTLNINKPVDQNGKPIEPSYAYFPGLVSIPLPFECSMTPRSSETVGAIQATEGSK